MEPQQENQPQLANCATPELRRQLTKRRSRESDADVYESTEAWLPKAAQGAPFAWPLDNVGEIFNATSKNVGGMVASTSQTMGCLVCETRQAAGELLARGSLAVKAQARAVRAQVSAVQAMTPKERGAATRAAGRVAKERARTASRAATERVRATSKLERGLFACVCLLLCTTGRSSGAVQPSPLPVFDLGAAFPTNQTMGPLHLQQELQAKDDAHKECLAEFQTHLDMMLGQYHLDKRSGARGAHLMEYAEAVRKRLMVLGMAPNFL